MHSIARACVYTRRTLVHEYSVVGGAPCSFLLTLLWFSSASKSQLWSTCSRVTTRTMTGLLRKPADQVNVLQNCSLFCSKILSISAGRDPVPSTPWRHHSCPPPHPHSSMADLRAAVFAKLSSKTKILLSLIVR